MSNVKDVQDGQDQKEQKEQREQKGNPGLYRFVWRWHFYAGLVFAPMLIMLSITGAIYLFKPYLEPMMDKELHFVKAGDSEIAPSLQLKAVKDLYPEASISNFTDRPERDRATEIKVSKDGVGYTVFVDPYTGKVLGELQNDKRLMEIIVLLHGEVMAGEIGDNIVELSASWAIILLITGLYLYWPRNKASFLSLFRVRIRQGKRLFWRDLHASTGFWMTVFILFLILTGLPWASSFGERLNTVVEAAKLSNAPANLWSGGGAESVQLAKDVAETSWAAENIHLPESVYANSGMLPIENIAQFAANANIQPGYTVAMPKDEKGIYLITLSGWAANSVNEYAVVAVDQYSGKSLMDYRWKDYSTFDKMIETGIALHEGRQFGWPNMLLNLIVCLSLILIVVSGITMWWKRRQKGTFGVPKKFEGYRLSIGVIIITIGLGLLMPLVGYTMLAALAIDLLIKLVNRARKSENTIDKGEAS
ncbi:PepSY-associated TM helix domain-containing protein [Paenibacillus sp. GCM10027627]|uniref:PepSY-associated TM helix domain-containing protein n=1 Tax=unclassified Paenibacillus TaxID=185978 RepID=UPI00363246CB